MKRVNATVVALAGCLVAGALVPLAGTHRRPGEARATTTTLRRVATIDLPGPPGHRFDYLTIDYDDRYLLASHLGAGLLYVIALDTLTLVATIPDVPGVEGVEYVPELKKVYTSDWWENKIGVIKLSEMKVGKKLPTEAKPDGMTYAAPFHKLYVSDERGRAEAVVDVREDRVVTTLHFDSETGVPLYDPVTRRVYVNLQDRNLLAAIDPASDTVVAQYPVAGCRGNHGMALDVEHHRAFLACEGNLVLTIFNLDTHEAIAHLPLPAGPDVVQFDPGLGRIYVACASGAIAVFEAADPDRVRKLEDVPVERKVHSLAVDVRTHRVYAPEEEAGGHPTARIAVFDAVVGDEGKGR